MENSSVMKKVWYIIAGVLFLLFLFFTPVNVYHSMGFFLNLIEGILFGFFLFMGMLGLESFGDLFYINEEENPILKSRRIVVVPMVAVILSAILFLIVTSERIDLKLKSHGIKTLASIDDGSSTTTHSLRRGDQSSYELHLTFKLQDESYYQTTTDVSRDVFNNVYKGEKVEILYLPENPSIIKVLADDENVQKFVGISNRELTFKDLEAVMDMKVDSIGNYLNGISTKWEQSKDSIGYVFINENKKALLAVTLGGNLLYKSKDVASIDNFMKGAKVIERKQEKGDETGNKVVKSITTYETAKSFVQFVMSIGREIEFYLIIRRKT